jgi:hypothetical protein
MSVLISGGRLDNLDLQRLSLVIVLLVTQIYGVVVYMLMLLK